MIKIGYVIDKIDSPTAGTERQLLSLIQNIDRTKYEPYLFTLQPSEYIDKEFEQCRVCNLNIKTFKSYNSWIKIWKLSRLFKKLKIDIIQPHFKDASIAAIIAAKIAGVSSIVGTRRNQETHKGIIDKYIHKNLNRFVTIFIANCVNTKDYFAELEGINTGKFEVIYNGIDLEKYEFSEEERTQKKIELGFSSNIIIGLVGNLRPVKAIDTFIRAAKCIYEYNPSVRFLVIGDGHDRKRLERICDDLDVNSYLYLLGKKQDVEKYLSIFDVGVLSSRSESFSSSIIEYLAAGLPVVCTDVGGAREAIGDSGGHVVPPGDWKSMAEKIISIIEGGNLTKYRSYGKDRCKLMFSREAMVTKYEQLYESLCRSI